MKQDVRTATAVDAYVGANLKKLRKKAGMSQTFLAEAVGVTFQQIQKYERGSNRIGASRLWGFCKIFEIKPGVFFEGVDAYVDQIASEAAKAEIVKPEAFAKPTSKTPARVN